MSGQWPFERQAEKREVLADSSLKTVQDFLEFLNVFPYGRIGNHDNVANWIEELASNPAELEQRTAQFADEFAPIIPDNHHLMIPLACAIALARTPSLHIWDKVKTLKYHSSNLEECLGQAMIAYAEINPPARLAYVGLAKQVFAALETRSIQSKSNYTNKERARAWAHWNECQSKLEEIWWDLRGHGFMDYEEELSLFHTFYKLDYDAFIRTISSSANPFLVRALLFVAGISTFSPRFSEWERMVAAAPVAFESDGKWNGSVLMPLLLVEARNQLLQARQSIINSTYTPEELNVIKIEITGTAEIIAGVLAKREDSHPLFTRWSAWLMRQAIGAAEKEITDVKSSSFTDSAMIEAISRHLDGKVLPQTSPDDALSWEPWCYRCVLASFAYHEHIPIPDWTSFLDEWVLSPEDWGSEKGFLLRTHASLITSLSKGIPGDAANLLAYPIAQSPAPEQTWIDLWNATITLREIVEFGDADVTNDEYNSRSEAGRLSLLLFRIGLAIFDQRAFLSSDNNSIEARSLARLFHTLSAAAYEMKEIDITLNSDEWLSVIKHLAVRRMIWEPLSSNEDAVRNFQVFKTTDTPTVSNMLMKAKGDVTELVSILQTLLVNSPNSLRLKTYLEPASIDLSNIVHSVRTLNQYHPYKYPIDESQLKKLASH